MDQSERSILGPKKWGGQKWGGPEKLWRCVALSHVICFFKLTTGGVPGATSRHQSTATPTKLFTFIPNFLRKHGHKELSCYCYCYCCCHCCCYCGYMCCVCCVLLLLSSQSPLRGLSGFVLVVFWSCEF
jgi:hypothetical protein